MCVIIHRLPNIVIEPAKIEAACTVNADGFGLAIADRGKIELIRELDPKGNNPERVLKLLEEAKDLPILLHLRFKTVGTVNLENCHPFTVTTNDDDGLDMVMCHNGTMQQFNITGTDFSDSYMFNEMIVKPLIERSLLSPDVDPKDVLDDEFVQLILEEFVPSHSIVSLMDGNGKTLHIHEKQGFEHEGWWSSNNYSFNVQHRTKSVTTFPGNNYNHTPGYASSMGGGTSTAGWPSWEDIDAFEDADQGLAGEADANLINTGSSTTPESAVYRPTLPVHTPATYEDTDQQRSDSRKEEFTKITHTMSQLKGSPCPSNSMLRLATSDRPSFISITKLDSLKQVCRLEREDIAELVHYYPEASIVLIQDLLKELYLKPHVEMTRRMDDAAEMRENEKRKNQLPVVQDLTLRVLNELKQEDPAKVVETVH